MADPLYDQVIEAILSPPVVIATLDPKQLEALRDLLRRGTVPKKGELAAILDTEDE